MGKRLTIKDGKIQVVDDDYGTPNPDLGAPSSFADGEDPEGKAARDFLRQIIKEGPFGKQPPAAPIPNKDMAEAEANQRKQQEAMDALYRDEESAASEQARSDRERHEAEADAMAAVANKQDRPEAGTGCAKVAKDPLAKTVTILRPEGEPNAAEHVRFVVAASDGLPVDVRTRRSGDPQHTIADAPLGLRVNPTTWQGPMEEAVADIPFSMAMFTPVGAPWNPVAPYDQDLMDAMVAKAAWAYMDRMPMPDDEEKVGYWDPVHLATALSEAAANVMSQTNFTEPRIAWAWVTFRLLMIMGKASTAYHQSKGGMLPPGAMVSQHEILRIESTPLNKENPFGK